MFRHIVYCLLAVCPVLGAVYYIEPAPVSPFSCTASHPCRLQDLPSSFTTADSVVFLPATTGTSSTYASNSKTLNKPSVTLSPGITFSAFTLNVANANSVSCTATVSFISASTLATAGVATVSFDGCNFDNSQLVAQTGTTVTFKNAAVNAMSSTKKIQLQGTSVTVDTVSFGSGSTSVPALSVLTGTADSTFNLNAISMSGVTTTGANSMVLMQSTNGKAFTSTLQSPSFTNCVSGAAFVEMRIGAGGGQSAFNCDGDLESLTASGGSVVQGIYYFNNNNAAATMSAIIAISTASNVNYNSGNAINLNANTGVIGVNGWQQSSNSFCGGSNEANLVACTGTQANANILLNGNTDGTTSVSGCGATTMVNMGSTC
jgi:hypothetical protein